MHSLATQRRVPRHAAPANSVVSDARMLQMSGCARCGETNEPRGSQACEAGESFPFSVESCRAFLILPHADRDDVRVRRDIHRRARSDMEQVRSMRAGAHMRADLCVCRLRERKAFESNTDTKEAAMYAARKVLEALGNMFGNAKSVMDWLNECARDIAQHGA